MAQEGIDLVFVVKGFGAAAIVESNALLPPPLPPTGRPPKDMILPLY